MSRLGGPCSRQEHIEHSAKIGRVLQAERVKAGLSYAEVARRSGISPSTVRRNFTGQIGHYWVRDLIAYARTFGMRCLELFALIEGPDAPVVALIAGAEGELDAQKAFAAWRSGGSQLNRVFCDAKQAARAAFGDTPHRWFRLAGRLCVTATTNVQARKAGGEWPS